MTLSPSSFVLCLCTLALLCQMTPGIPITQSSDQGSAFRPPAIPLFTTDPYMQTWMRADTLTEDAVRHWDGVKREMQGLVRVDGETFSFLGNCTNIAPSSPGPVTTTENTDVSPGSCDIANFADVSWNTCNEICYGYPDCAAFVMRQDGGNHTTCFLKSCAKPLIPSGNHQANVLTGSHENFCFQPATQTSLTVSPTQTAVVFTVASKIQLNLTFTSTMYATDYVRLSRPVYYATINWQSIDDKAHAVQVYFDASAEHAVNTMDEVVTWSSWSHGSLNGVQIGTVSQNVLGFAADQCNINWGYLHLTAAPELSTGNATVTAGSVAASRLAFNSTGQLFNSKNNATDQPPRPAIQDLPGLSVSFSFSASSTQGVAVALMAYDDIDSVYYFGSKYKAFWTTVYDSIQDALVNASTNAEYDYVISTSTKVDNFVWSTTSAKGGEKYATVASLAYRQTLAATKLVWNSDRQVMWNFLKEISTNGDMQTMDVVYPASPMMLYTNPILLRDLLIPVLVFANNETWHTFTNPFSPHQLGTYPLANATTAEQEPMPMENTGNMFLMLAGIVQRDIDHDTSFFYPHFWPLLTSWADYLIDTLPFPGNQLCTDDFEGLLANNTNLAAKGIVALQAFGELCTAAGAGNCSFYMTKAKQFADTWVQYAYDNTTQPPHYRLSDNMPGTWSIKYNLVWQKLLQLDAPFDWEKVAGLDTQYYLTKMNQYGPPLDERHTYVKLDWLSWAATMAENDQFNTFFDPIYDFLNVTPDRVPMTDLYDTISAHASMMPTGFIARPVVGAVFAKMLTV
eukprot:m.76478 g.76478  ORF g.76478 m.76478 type:complete len:796 (+) comp12486_c0_seq7:30-2417(+)